MITTPEKLLRRVGAFVINILFSESNLSTPQRYLEGYSLTGMAMVRTGTVRESATTASVRWKTRARLGVKSGRRGEAPAIAAVQKVFTRFFPLLLYVVICFLTNAIDIKYPNLYN